MELTEKHINYENECHKMFIGQTIRSIIYGEVKSISDKGENITNPDPGYLTSYTEVDTLDHSIYFQTDNKSIYVCWDSTFCCYGLLSKKIDLTKNTNNFEQKWDVSNKENWKPIIGQKITDFKILWEETNSLNIENTNKIFVTYPQAFQINTENGMIVIISASELMEKVYPMMDNLLVTTNAELAKELGLIN